MTRDDFEQIVSEFEHAWRNGQAPRIDQVIANADIAAKTSCNDLLVELVAIDMEYRWRIGWQDAETRGPSTSTNVGQVAWQLERYVALFPGLENDEVIRELVVEEFRARQQWGDQPNVEEYVSRFGPIAEAVLPELNEIASRRQQQEKQSPDSETSLADFGPPDLPDYELLEQLGS